MLFMLTQNPATIYLSHYLWKKKNKKERGSVAYDLSLCGFGISQQALVMPFYTRL